MSIEDEIKRFEGEGSLRLLKPLFPGGPHDRAIYVLPCLEAEICGPWNDGRDGFRMSFLHRDLDRFSAGDHLTVGHGGDDDCDLKPLDPESDEVWEFRSRAPQPSYRLFGSFAAKDVLILTNMEQRKPLGPKRSREWAIEIGICKAEWRKLFPYYAPHHGENVNEYISAPVTDLRDIESR